MYSKIGFIGLLVSGMLLMHSTAFAQQDGGITARELKKLSVEELMNVEVSLVSRSPQRLAEAASAVQVITGEDIRNSGATNIAEALRLVSNLQVAQLRSDVWLVGARGFNTLFANKLLVMIDGRTVYSPLFAGVFWNMQNVLLEEVERIEVVSGPGGILWGANAVNGVINIITKSSAASQGLYATVLAGSHIQEKVAISYGGKIGKKITYKTYGQHFDRKPMQLANGTNNSDAWRVTQGGFRMDWNGGKNEADTYTVQGDYYGGTLKSKGGNSDFDGQNMLARWRRTFSEQSDLTLQVYYDRYFREDKPGRTSDEINTADLDLQYRFKPAKNHSIVTGLGYRRVNDHFISNTPNVAILPARKDLDLINGFVQDEIALSAKLKVTVGTKILHNVYTGVEFQPGIRSALSVGSSGTLWAAVTRAVRTPSRLDVDYFIPAAPQPPTVPSVGGGPDFKSEKLNAFELGYRVQPTHKTSVSIATFYNQYNDVYSVEVRPGTQTYLIQNGSECKSWGAELSGAFQISNKWRIRAGYTYFDKELRAKAGHSFDPAYLGNDVKHQAMLQSMVDLPLGLHLDVVARYLDSLPKTLSTIAVPSYFTFDTRLAYTFKFAELSLVGQNLFEKRHAEFGSLTVPRHYYAKLTFRL